MASRLKVSFRSHQVPVTDLFTKPGHLKILEDWMRSYKAEELFDADGRFKASWLSLRLKAIAAWE